MSLKDLTKEQKQYIMLGVIVTLALLVLTVFGIKVSLSSITEAKTELAELSGKIASAEKSVERSRNQHEEFLSTIEQLREHLDIIPPERNYYSWATEVIYKEARAVNFEIDAIDEMVIATLEDIAPVEGAVQMESYALRITAHGGYENVKQLLGRLSDNHPLMRVTGIEISTGSKADVHDVQLFIEWPFNMEYITKAWNSTGSQALDPNAATNTVESDADKTPTSPERDEISGFSSGAVEARASARTDAAHHISFYDNLAAGGMA